MDKMRGVVVLYVGNCFGRIKKFWVLHGRHNSPKRTIIRTISIDVIHHHRDVSGISLGTLFHRFASPQSTTTISLFLLHFGRWNGVHGGWHKAWTFPIQRVFGMHTRRG